MGFFRLGFVAVLLVQTLWGASDPNCELSDLSEVPVTLASQPPFNIDPELARVTLASERGPAFLAHLKAAQWLQRNTASPLLEKLAASVYDPALNRALRERDGQWAQTLGQTDAKPLTNEQMRRAILDESIKLTGVRIPESVKDLWTKGLEQLPYYKFLGPPSSAEEMDVRIKSFLQRSIPPDVRKWIGRPSVGKYIPSNRQARRTLNSATSKLSSEESARNSLEKSLKDFVKKGAFRDLNPETPGARERLGNILAGTSASVRDNPAIRGFVTSYFSTVLLGEKTSRLQTPELVETLRAPLVSKARDLAAAEKSRMAQEARKQERAKRQEQTGSRTYVALPKREARPVDPDAGPKKKPEPITPKKSLIKPEELGAKPTASDDSSELKLKEKVVVTFPLANPTGMTIFARDKALAHFVETGEAGSAPWSRYSELLAEKLTILASLKSLNEIGQVFPSLEIYALEHQAYRGLRSIRLDSQWRIIFHWDGERAVNVLVDDYHGEVRGNFNVPLPKR